jgi:hypothetical protein
MILYKLPDYRASLADPDETKSPVSYKVISSRLNDIPNPSGSTDEAASPRGQP